MDPCGTHPITHTYQVVYSCSAFPIEPYQQLFPFQSGSALQCSAESNYEIEITEGSNYAYMERLAYSDSLGNFYEAEYLGSLISGLPGYLLSGTGEYQGWQPTGTLLRENPTNYYIHFDNYSELQTNVTVRITNLNTQVTTYWHTVIVNPQYQIVNQQLYYDTLLHYYSKDVSLSLYNINSAGCQHPGYGGCPPTDVTFNIEIIEGQQYGSIKSGLTGDISTSFTSIPFSELYIYTYRANGVQPDSTTTVRIRHSSSDADITPVEFSFIVKRNSIPPPSEGGSIYVKMNKEVVFPGDTVNVQLLRVDEVGDTTEFLPMQSFRVDLAEGSEYGTVLDIQTGDTSDTFTEIGNMFKVIVNNQITPEQAKIIIVAEADLLIWSRPVSINNKDQEKENEHSSGKVDDGGGITPDIIIIGDHIVGVGEITIVKDEPAEIMLGETKYYGVKQKTENANVTEIKIEEIKVSENATPVFPTLSGSWSWIKDSNIWSGRPINIETKGQSPIFYDKFSATIYDSGTTTPPTIQDLPEGMIRVIGRYLGKTPDNKVKLFTTQYQNSFTDTLEIQVIRPKKLGDNTLSILGPTKVDYVDSTYNNIDSLVVDMAGQLGIPPQFLMGIVEQESPNGLGYRYEPFSDIRERKEFRSLYPTHRYWIESETNLGDPAIPHHNNIEDALGPIDNYPGYTTVWTIFNEKNEGGMYTLNVYHWYRDDYWDPYQKYYYKKLKNDGLDTLIAMDSSRVLADTSYVIFLRDSIEGIGMKGTIAQTRIFASYGFMQLVYSSAITTPFNYNYPNNDPDFLPEYIMIPTINISYASKHLLAKLRSNKVLKKVY